MTSKTLKSKKDQVAQGILKFIEKELGEDKDLLEKVQNVEKGHLILYTLIFASDFKEMSKDDFEEEISSLFKLSKAFHKNKIYSKLKKHLEGLEKDNG